MTYHTQLALSRHSSGLACDTGLEHYEVGGPRKQVMSAFIMLPLLLRFLNIK